MKAGRRQEQGDRTETEQRRNPNPLTRVRRESEDRCDRQKDFKPGEQQ